MGSEIDWPTWTPNTICDCVRVGNSLCDTPHEPGAGIVVEQFNSRGLGFVRIIARLDCPRCGGSGLLATARNLAGASG